MGNEQSSNRRERREPNISTGSLVAVGLTVAVVAGATLYKYVTTPREVIDSCEKANYREIEIIESHLQKISKDISHYEQANQLLPSDYEACYDFLELTNRLINRIHQLQQKEEENAYNVIKQFNYLESDTQLLKEKITKILSTANNKSCETKVVNPSDNSSTNLYSFTCPITHEIMTDPVLLIESGVTYERSAIEQWLKNHNTDPLTNITLTSKQIVPVISLRNAINEWSILNK
eukprot:TRINITY_DN3615_c0_g1_i1.p1 TRINITY_DN3615_c0_g1~~TRINITY_DN3615_c0_g1_i1.p1  ORF type:complete len:255 (-),score=30.37 TRINITY_DN3615_c0_g1_i1:51-752(-)